MSTVQPFTFLDQAVRVVTDEAGEPWFVASDVCSVLEIANNRDAIVRLAEDEKGVVTTDTLGGPQQVGIVSEAGLYRLIFTSRKPDAEQFRRWVTHDVLPAIRRTGTYSVPAAPAIPSHAEALRAWATEIEAREVAEAKVAELEPKAEVAERLLNADGDVSVGDAAKILTRGGVKVGADRLFKLLASWKWIYRAAGDGRWRVHQRAIETGYMSVINQSHYHPKSGVLVLDPPQPRVTPKGIQKILREHGAGDVDARQLMSGEPA